MDVPDSMFMLAADSDIDEAELEEVVQKIKRKMREVAQSKVNSSQDGNTVKMSTSDSEGSDTETKTLSSKPRKRKKAKNLPTDCESAKKKTKGVDWATGSQSQEAEKCSLVSPETPDGSTVIAVAEEKTKRKLDKRLERLLQRKKKDILNMLNKKRNERLDHQQNKKKSQSEKCKICSASITQDVDRNARTDKTVCYNKTTESIDSKQSQSDAKVNTKESIHLVLDSGIDMNDTECVICTCGKGQSSDSEVKGMSSSSSPALDIPSEDNYVALDCEFVGVGPRKSDALGRVSVVDFYGTVLYDVHCQPDHPITDYRTPWSGIRPSNMKTALPFSVVQERVQSIIQDKYVIGHAVFNDFRVLGINHPGYRIRDTSAYKPLREMASYATNCSCSLKKMSWALLGRSIQSGEHDSVDDARATLDLYKLVRTEWEKKIKGRASKRANFKVTSHKVIRENLLGDEYWLTELFSNQESGQEFI